MPHSPTQMTDEMLLNAIQAGDEEAFDSLFIRYYPILCAYAKRFVGLDDSEEIVQDTMLWLWENSRQSVIETSLKSYLFKSVKNRCLTLMTHYEMRERVENKLYQSLQTYYEDPDFYIVDELRNRIDDALARLPESYRESFVLNRFNQMTYQQIAQKLNISSKTVDYRIQQALKLLRKELKDYLPLLLAMLH